ncbi:DMT family transporter [Pseudoduganella sp. SL102]|uniref:DMT family transporter n=1 Tax=Pseudoduganella sp. SL102 TaxID=2995154 RepID=UPI00248CE9CC|nr:DMT family transporter [Pseudoduganella sp. SL102]WBS01278.1 DMT family transporter [Pseudoduganella sp. SL102]
MSASSTAAQAATVTRRSDETAGMLLGLAGVAIFSLTLPFTRLAVAELSPMLVTMGRAVVAALLAGLWLWWQRAPLPGRGALPGLLVVAAGCVIGFPLLTSFAMRSLPASHGAVLVGILPLATALFSALRGHERPSPGFWCAALAGSGLVVGFALSQSGGALHVADVLMLGAVLAAGMGYAEGGRLSQALGGQQVISWALLLSLPVALPLAGWDLWRHGGTLAGVGAAAWGGFAYTCVFSMFVGFIFWYRGMARGGVARVGQVQLLQPFLTLLGAAIVLGEPLQAAHLLFALAVIGTVALGRRMAVKR